MGVEAYPFLHRVEVRRRWRRGRAVYRDAFFEGSRLLIIRSGVGPHKASLALRYLDEEPAAIINAGTAGGLVPNISHRELVVCSETVFGDEPERIVAWPAHLVNCVADACSKESVPYRVARIATTGQAVFARDERQRLHEATGAHAVDMESHALGLEALKLGVPFTSLRVISDDVNAPPLPTVRDLKNLWLEPREIPEKLSQWLRWRKFLSQFRTAIQELHPVLVRVVRTWEKTSR